MPKWSDELCRYQLHQEDVRYLLPGTAPDEDRGRLPLTVVFTESAPTLAALRKAAGMASQLGAAIRILVPTVVPYPLPLEKPHVDPLFQARHFRTVCEREPVETFIDIRYCRDAAVCIAAALRPHSLILIGIKREQWPLAREKRLAGKLRRLGHEVILVPLNPTA